MKDGKQRFKRNNEEFLLDTETGSWTQTTDRNWPQWSIGQQDGELFILDHDVRVVDLIPRDLQRIPTVGDGDREARFMLQGVPIRVIVGVKRIEIVAEGDLPEELRREVPEVFRKRIETLCKKDCVPV
jgi:hypothetical protein